MAKILLIEDEPDNRDLIVMTLEMAGHRVEHAVTGEDGITQARASLPDLVLMDLSLAGGIDGLEATRFLRADSSFDRTPIVALTAHAMRGDREKALAAGCDDYITKPITDLMKFIEAVDGHLSRGRPGDGR